ncbi:unnamed protein product [Adineta ricciae]|uniref:F-box domain-containing protein n=1 Tax=Adineta ricciae TaxID=249248 RepID=A0A815VCF8_ADIRI|nr:unnamed protein product [Adineta ricciae]CAF1526334.1 unnamed protein product [Adineta ricciae]
MSIQRALNSNKTPSKTRIEDLPTELIFGVFDYLYCHEIINAFQQLNSYFQSLLQTYQQYHVNLSALRRIWHSNVIHQLSKYTQQIQCLKLSCKKDLLIDLNEYLILYPLNLYYSTLQSLSLSGTDINQLKSFVFELQYFQQLKHLSLTLCQKFHDPYSMPDSRFKLICFILLFKIKTLKFLSWNVDLNFFSGKDSILSGEKSTIEHYEFSGMTFNDLNWLQLYTKNMKSLSVHNFTGSFDKIHRLSIETLITLKLYDIPQSVNIQLLFEQFLYLPQLIHLEFQSELYKESDIDGNHWKYLIENYIPHIKRFRFFFFVNSRIVSQPYDNIIESFKTDFWLRDKKWFINCEFLEGYRLFVYTLPCIKTELNYLVPYQRKSTSSSPTISIPLLYLDLVSARDHRSNLDFDRVRSLSIFGFGYNMNYNQICGLINISFVKQLTVLEDINPELFFDILEHHPTQLSIRMFEHDFSMIVRARSGVDKKKINADRMAPLKKIKSLKLMYSVGSFEEAFQILTHCSKLEELEITGTMPVEIVKDIIDNLEKLSFLKIHLVNWRHNVVNKLLESNGQQRRFVYKHLDKSVLIWID